jgi:hypothetical protein
MANAFEQSHPLFVIQASGDIRNTVQTNEHDIPVTLPALIMTIEILKEEKESLFRLIAELLYKNQILRQTRSSYSMPSGFSVSDVAGDHKVT